MNYFQLAALMALGVCLTVVYYAILTGCVTFVIYIILSLLNVL